MPTRSNLTRANTLFFGSAYYSRFNRVPGIEMTPLYLKNYGAILTADADGVVASQDLTAAGVFSGAGIAGALASGGVATFDKPRNVVAAWTNAAVITVTGTDEYGSIMVESSASGTSFTGNKAFKTVTAVAVSADVTGLTVGTGVKIGLPYRVDANEFISARQTNAVDAATFVPAVTTDPATATTGDVRGTLTFATAPNDTRTYSALIKVADPSTKVGAFGVKQFGSSDSV